MKRYLLLIVCLFGALGSVFAPRALCQDSSSVQELVRGNSEFAVDLYKRLGANEDNLFFSPYSISAAFAMTYAGARAATARQMAAVLHFHPEDGQLHSAFAQLNERLDAIREQQNVELSVANSLWPAAGYPFLTEYLDLVREYYQTEITPVDYLNDPEGTRRKINAWVEQKTEKRIQDIIPRTKPPFLLPLTRLALVNAIYFKGAWANKFDESATKPRTFHLTEGVTADVPMMHQEAGFNYGEDEIVQVLEMPYAGREVSMIVMLPRRIDGLREVESGLTVDRLEQWSTSTYPEEVEVYVPRFNMTYSVELKESLKEMGMPDAFCSEEDALSGQCKTRADFSGMDGGQKRPYIYLYSALHKAFVELTEEGTEAAAATVVAGCFPAGTQVHTENGLRAIESLEPGATVYAYDLLTERWALSKVLERKSYDYQGDMVTIHIGEDSLQSTGNQPFFVLRGERLAERRAPDEVASRELSGRGGGRWVEARDLEEGDVLRSRGGTSLVVASISSRRERIQVYGLDIEPHHNCAVHRLGVVAHNGGKKEATPQPVLFRADHPFLFLIRDTANGTILFMGRVRDPR